MERTEVAEIEALPAMFAAVPDDMRASWVPKATEPARASHLKATGSSRPA